MPEQKLAQNEIFDLNCLLLKIDETKEDAQSGWVPATYQVDKNGVPVGTTRTVDWQFGFTGVVTLTGCKSVSISNRGNSSVSVVIYAADGTTVAQTRTIPSGSSIAAQADGLDVLPKMVLTATGSSVDYGVA